MENGTINKRVKGVKTLRFTVIIFQYSAIQKSALKRLTEVLFLARLSPSFNPQSNLPHYNLEFQNVR